MRVASVHPTMATMAAASHLLASDVETQYARVRHVVVSGMHRCDAQTEARHGAQICVASGLHTIESLLSSGVPEVDVHLLTCCVQVQAHVKCRIQVGVACANLCCVLWSVHH